MKLKQQTIIDLTKNKDFNFFFNLVCSITIIFKHFSSNDFRIIFNYFYTIAVLGKIIIYIGVK